MEATQVTETTPQVAVETPVSRLRQLINERFAEPAEQKPETEVAPELSPEIKEEKVQEPPKPKDRVELALARAQNELKKLTTSEVELKSQLKKYDTELTSLKEQFNKNPLKAIELATGRKLQDIFNDAKQGKYDDRSQDLPPEIQEKLSFLDQLREKEKERESRESEKQRLEERKLDFAVAVPRVRALIESDADRYPYLAATDKAPEEVVEMIYQELDHGNQTPNVQEILTRANETAKDYATFWLRQPNIVKLVAQDEGVKSLLVEALGLSKQPLTGSTRSTSPTAPKVAQTSVSTLSEVGSRQEVIMNEADRKREIMEEWNRVRNIK